MKTEIHRDHKGNEVCDFIETKNQTKLYKFSSCVLNRDEVIELINWLIIKTDEML